MNQTNIEEDNLSYFILETSQRINLFLTMLVIVFGFIGNSLIISVFIQKRFRSNSSNVFLLCIAINDNCFLVIHFFEDTLKNIDLLFDSQEFRNFIWLVNIIDKYELLCRLIHYLRFVLRFISAYIIVTFTLQRLSIVSSPLNNKIKTKQSAWFTVLTISFFAFFLNLWVLFAFKIKSYGKNLQLCDPDSVLITEYVSLTVIYVMIVMIVPSLTIIVSNFIIMHQTSKAEKFKLINTRITRITSTNLKSNQRNNLKSIRKRKSKFLLRPHYINLQQIINKISNRDQSYRKLTRTLLMVSSSYAFLNIPYLVSLALFYFNVNVHKNTTLVTANYMASAVKLTEVFYLLNYGVNFFIYCASGSIFRKQLRYSSKNCSFFNFFH